MYCRDESVGLSTLMFIVYKTGERSPGGGVRQSETVPSCFISSMLHMLLKRVRRPAAEAAATTALFTRGRCAAAAPASC